MPAVVIPPPKPTPRADAGTPLGFTLPTVGLDRDTWGDITNANWALVDQLIAGLQSTNSNAAGLIAQLVANIHAYIEPIGSMKMWPTSAAPLGWTLCDGKPVPRVNFAELFAVIGTSWGAGDGSTTFNVPNLTGCVPVMFGDWMPFGGRLGEITQTLSLEQMPGHNHTGTTEGVGDHSHSYAAARFGGEANVQGGFTGALQEIGNQTGGAGGHAHTFTTSVAGAWAPHNNVQPSVGISFIIKVGHAF
jgi:microcystin-dependent protein